jgi:hypothetical protein
VLEHLLHQLFLEHRMHTPVGKASNQECEL